MANGATVYAIGPDEAKLDAYVSLILPGPSIADFDYFL